MNRPKGLGRGLDALLGVEESKSKDAMASLPVGSIRPGKYQPRTRMDEQALAELAASIRAQGLMQPLLVRPVGGNQYELIAGERRWRAAQLAGLGEVPVLVRDVPDNAALAMALIENIQREDLNPIEEASGVQRLIEEFRMTHEQAADAVGRSRSATTNLLRLLKLAKPVQALLMQGTLEMGHARALLALDKATQITAANQIAARKLSVRETEALVKKLSAEFSLTPSPRRGGPEKSRNLLRVEEELADLLTSEVEVRVKKRSKRNGRIEESGELAIHFGSLEALNGLIERIRRTA